MKTILITGANRGIGLELVKQYCDAGWKVYATCRHPEKALSLPKSAIPLKLEVTNTQDIAALQATLSGIPLDILINNAGVSLDKDPANRRPEIFREILEANTIAPYFIIQALLPNIALSRLKIIANMSSGYASISENTTGTASLFYKVSKAGLNMLTKSLSIDLKPQGITVISLRPGFVKTDMGGQAATIDAETSVKGLRHILDNLTLKNTGEFISYDGQRLAW